MRKLAVSTSILAFNFALFVPICGFAAPQSTPTLTVNIEQKGRGIEATSNSEVIIVSARRRDETAQSVPIALTAIGSEALSKRGAFSIQAVSTQVPTLQYTSSNPRNTALNIRGLGVSFGLANDGLEQGVGFYVDQVYNSRPAASAFDLLDIARVEILRGPQGTLFGKNTTAGAVSITTKLPSFDHEAEIEVSGGSAGFVQAKGVVSGPILKDHLAFRIAAGITQREGFIRLVPSNRLVNDLDNQAIRGQLLWVLEPSLKLRLVGDYNLSDADCCTQVYAGYGPTLRSAGRQFPALASALNYAPPSLNPYDRIADANAPIAARSELSGVSLIADKDLGGTALTLISAWRSWDWRPANDRDYTSLDILRQSANPVQQEQITHELRLASKGVQRLNYTIGLFAFRQKLKGQNVTEWGRDASFWLLGTATSNGTPIRSNLLDGYITRSNAVSTIDSRAAFAQVIWRASETITLTTGLRYTDEIKKADYAAQVEGGLATPNNALINAKLSIFRPQAYRVRFGDDAWTGDINLSWQPISSINLYVNYAKGFKSGGINLAGLPFNATNNPALDRAIISPEETQAYELGLKSQWFERRLTANVALFKSDVQDFQANVVDTGPGALRGYLANIEAVRSQGVELDLTLAPIQGLSAYLRTAFTDATYRSFKNAPCPLELIGNTTSSCDLSGKELPGTSPVALSLGAEYRWAAKAQKGEYYIGVDGTSRSSFFADASDSAYLKIRSYDLFNLRAGFTAEAGWEVFVLVRNVTDHDYMTLLTPQSGNSGFFSGVPGDPRTTQLTLRYHY
ncbi:TonB-dependent receptor [Candidatus Phycosocius spiralis]|nr:TonB-dependent receptor [Candidatus Phycosocius spiralis]